PGSRWRPDERHCIACRTAGLPGYGAPSVIARHARHACPAGRGDMSLPSLLSLQGVHTHIGAYHILHGVDLQVPEGQLTMLLGRNGAGKSTTLRTIMGLWPTRTGDIRFDGTPIGGSQGALRTPDIARLGIAYVPESMGIFADLSVKENMVLAARSARHAGELDTTRLEWIFGMFPALRKFWLYQAGKLSGGQ